MAKPTTTSAEAAKPPKEKETKAPGVGAVAMQLLQEGKTNEEILAEIKKRFPDGKTEMASVNWYRNKARADGLDVKTSRELNAGKPNPKKEAAAKAKAEKAEAKEKAAKEKAEAKEKAAKEKAAEKEKVAQAKAAEKEKQRIAKEKADALAAKEKEKAAQAKAKADAVAAKAANKGKPASSALD